MDTLKQYAVEVVASLWLIIVAVQFLSRYLIPGSNPDFSPAYLGMLVLTVAVFGVRAYRAIRGHLEKDRQAGADR